MNKDRSQSLDEALRTINEAMLEQGASLRDLVQSDCANLRTAIEDLAPRWVQQFKEATSPFVDKAREAKDSVKNTARDVAGPQIDFAVANGRTLAKSFDQQVKTNPYMVLGAVALGAVALGYLFGKSKTPPPADLTGLSYGDAPLAENTNSSELA